MYMKYWEVNIIIWQISIVRIYYKYIYIFYIPLLRQCYCSKNINVLYYWVVELFNDEIRRNDTLYPCTFFRGLHVPFNPNGANKLC